MGAKRRAAAVGFVERVRTGLAELRRLDPKLSIFGASSHEYRLAATVGNDTVTAMETTHGFQFPADYRAFVTELGGGGAGPGYGVLPFGMIDDSYGYAPWTTWKLAPGKPFPHQSQWNDLTIAERGAPRPDDYETAEEYEAARDEWFDGDEAGEAEEAYWAAVGTQFGCIPICHHGCALRDWLVVSGPEAGHVWHDASADQLGIAPVSRGDRERTTFAAWYLDWLDGAIAELR